MKGRGCNDDGQKKTGLGSERHCSGEKYFAERDSPMLLFCESFFFLVVVQPESSRLIVRKELTSTTFSLS